MYVRIVRGQPQPEQAEELARRWKEYAAPRLNSAPGFRHGYLSVERTTNRVAGVTVWDNKPGEAVDQTMREFGQQVQDIIAVPPVIEDYEVLAEA
ncbi:MAG: antibiotic biosynthesis monooxygenase [Chloroflexia bacterium]|nr:antibiotic biosynthesis monooxygenase [Chloroflexia bacterium]